MLQTIGSILRVYGTDMVLTSGETSRTIRGFFRIITWKFYIWWIRLLPLFPVFAILAFTIICFAAFGFIH